jgi:ABC-type multidrug transport system ATPase subunit
MSSLPHSTVPLLLQVHQLSGGPDAQAVIHDLDFAWPAGLSWICGDEGSGKTTLLRLLAGDLQPHSGQVIRPAGGVFWADLQGAEHDPNTVQDCWQQCQTLYPHWDAPLLQDLAEELDMVQHRHKPLFMLSAGSRRKVGLIAALASGASVTLLDQPFAALDQRSVLTTKAFLGEAAHAATRAWIVADYEPPNDLPLARVLQLPWA